MHVCQCVFVSLHTCIFTHLWGNTQCVYMNILHVHDHMCLCVVVYVSVYSRWHTFVHVCVSVVDTRQKEREAGGGRGQRLWP